MDDPEWITNVPALLSCLRLDAQTAPYRTGGEGAYALRVPRSFVLRMKPGDWFDPLLLQVLPRVEEGDEVPQFRDDAVGEGRAEIIPGLMVKYAGRALLLVSTTCALNCRFCLRRSHRRGAPAAGQNEQEAAWAWLRESPDVGELVLSGGDPLMLDNAAFARLVERVRSVPHLRTLRIHTRVPVALPGRVDGELLDILKLAAADRTLVIVIHANHGRELGGECTAALRALRGTGALMLHQMVLLRGINDDAGVLTELCSLLVHNGVLPYYLHQLDRVRGTAHFEVDVRRGGEIVGELRRRLPGYAVPRYVREKAGAPFKIPL